MAPPSMPAPPLAGNSHAGFGSRKSNDHHEIIYLLHMQPGPMSPTSTLTVGPDELVPEASLIDDLAADSLDLMELAVVIESTFGITLTRHRMDEVRSYRDLLDTVMESVERGRARELVLTPGLGVKSRLVPPGASEAMLERADALTAYAIQTIREDAMGARPGTHLEVTLPAEASTVDLASVRDALAGLGRRGIAVSVRFDAPVSAAIPV